MPHNKYTTKRQRKTLQSIGVAHVSGRTYDEAETLITKAIQSGRLLPDCMQEPATSPQLRLLYQIGVATPPGLTKEQAKQIIDAKLAERGKSIPMTDKQVAFIYNLGGITNIRMSCYEASKYIEWLLVRRTRCSHCQAEHDRRSPRCWGCGRYLQSLEPLAPPRELFKAGIPAPPIIGPPIPMPDNSQSVWQDFRKLFRL